MLLSFELYDNVYLAGSIIDHSTAFANLLVPFIFLIQKKPTIRVGFFLYYFSAIRMDAPINSLNKGCGLVGLEINSG